MQLVVPLARRLIEDVERCAGTVFDVVLCCSLAGAAEADFVSGAAELGVFEEIGPLRR